MDISSSSSLEEEEVHLLQAEEIFEETENPLIEGQQSNIVQDDNNPAQTQLMPWWRFGTRSENPQARQAFLLKVFRRGNLIVIFALFALSTALLVSISLDWNQSCPANLNLWATVQLVTQVVLMCLYAIQLCCMPNRITDVDPNSGGLRCMLISDFIRRPVNLFSFAWFIYGAVIIYPVDSCDAVTLLFVSKFVLSVISVLFSIIALLFLIGLGAFLFLYFTNPSLFRGKQKGATQSELDKLETDTFHEGMFEDSQDSMCAVCLGDYAEGDPLRYLPCKHHFHKECIDQWLLINKICPFCKSLITKSDSDKAESQETPLESDNQLEQVHVDL